MMPVETTTMTTGKMSLKRPQRTRSSTEDR
jgi:hypothetical protein